ncbi:MAG: hypothetical protein E7126_04180 [Rikenellaceae bacterium]|nr:hypothetical protein [Rikenellaceae bacterium]
MKQTYFLATIALFMALTACQKPVPIEDEKQQTIEVTYNSLMGCWRLTHLNGEPLLDESMMYIDFVAPAKDGEVARYEMWDNLGSMYLRQTTGTYTITKEESGTYTLRGTYDNGVGDWNEEYRVDLFQNDRMLWWARTSGVCMEFIFAIEKPEEFYY